MGPWEWTANLMCTLGSSTILRARSRVWLLALHNGGPSHPWRSRPLATGHWTTDTTIKIGYIYDSSSIDRGPQKFKSFFFPDSFFSLLSTLSLTKKSNVGPVTYLDSWEHLYASHANADAIDRVRHATFFALLNNSNNHVTLFSRQFSTPSAWCSPSRLQLLGPVHLLPFQHPNSTYPDITPAITLIRACTGVRRFVLYQSGFTYSSNININLYEPKRKIMLG